MENAFATHETEVSEAHDEVSHALVSDPSITAVEVTFAAKKFMPDTISELPPEWGALPSRWLTTATSNDHTRELVPHTAPTETVVNVETTATREATHCTTVAENHDKVMQRSPLTATVCVCAAAPKLSPITSIAVYPL